VEKKGLRLRQEALESERGRGGWVGQTPARGGDWGGLGTGGLKNCPSSPPGEMAEFQSGGGGLESVGGRTMSRFGDVTDGGSDRALNRDRVDANLHGIVTKRFSSTGRETILGKERK